jgi:hypothetical protein
MNDLHRIERLRGWIISFLYAYRPNPLELSQLLKALDQKNFPLSRRRLAEELDFLASKSEERESEARLIRIFPAEAQNPITETEQAKLIQLYGAADNDNELEEMLSRTGFPRGPLCARITAVGQNFQEGRRVWSGIERVW